MVAAADLSEHEVYNGFSVLKIIPLTEYEASGVWLRHDRTGLEVFHLRTDDAENLFAFAFKTPAANSRGAAHILEHSVLNGSSRFPLKDPFVRLVNQSIKTFLNAMTFPDKTVFPASSLSRTDYFNLMSVYGDAVFFPLLTRQCFLQEAHRLEFDGDTPVIQGVVYNEMKGCYSSFENIAADASVYSLFEDTPYMFDSGGDPVEIPLLTHEELREFHARYYAPQNCRVFLYGNIGTKEQLDFIDTHFLSRMKDTADMPPAPEIPKAPRFAAPRVYTYPAPACGQDGADEKGCTVTLNWRLGDSFDTAEHMACGFLSDVLVGNDGSPLVRVLLESGLGEDIAPNTGVDSSLREMFFTVGLRGVPQEKSHAVEKVILSALESLCRDGIDDTVIEAALMGAEIEHREVKRSGGPYSLTLMRRSLRGWLHGCPPYQSLYISEPFAELKARIAADRGYVCSLIKRLLLDNTQRSLVIVYPDESYAAQRAEREQQLAENVLAQTTKDRAAADIRALTAYQEQPDSEQLCRLIPHVRPSELPAEIDRITVTKTLISGGVPLYTSEEAANGIIYADIAFPADTAAITDLPLLPAFASALTNAGYGAVSWAESALQTALYTGGMGASVYTASAVPEELRGAEDKELLVGRRWLFLRFKTVADKLPQALDLAAEYMLHAHFTDTARLQDLVTEFRNDLDASVIPAGHEYALSRAVCRLSLDAAVDEIWNGLSQVYTARSLCGMDMAVLGASFDRLRQQLLDAGCVLHITAGKKDMAAAYPLLERFAANCGLHAPAPPHGMSAADLQPLLLLAGEDSFSDTESVILPSQTGFASLAAQSSRFGTAESAAEYVLAHWLGTTLLWEQIRTVGGAYGVFASADSLAEVFSFSTYRDPKPLRSLDIFSSCLQSVQKEILSAEMLERTIAGCYSRLVQPRSPSGRGFTGFIRALYGMTNEMQEQRLADVLAVSAADMYAAAERIGQNLGNRAVRTVLCGEAEKPQGSIVRLSV